MKLLKETLGNTGGDAVWVLFYGAKTTCLYLAMVNASPVAIAAYFLLEGLNIKDYLPQGKPDFSKITLKPVLLHSTKAALLFLVMLSASPVAIVGYVLLEAIVYGPTFLAWFRGEASAEPKIEKNTHGFTPQSPRMAASLTGLYLLTSLGDPTHPFNDIIKPCMGGSTVFGMGMAYLLVGNFIELTLSTINFASSLKQIISPSVG